MTPTFIPVLKLEDIPEGEARLCTVQGQDVALFHVEGCVYATQDECTHGRASLVDGYLLGDEVECPLHQGMFNVRTGAPTAPPCTEPLRTYAVRIAGGVIHVAASAATAES
jgi:naphthalene 1,2-dioxygenase system ferredoxin subunit